MKKFVVILLFVSSAAFAENQAVADYAADVQKNLDSYHETYQKFRDGSGSNNIQNSLNYYKRHFKILEGWLEEESQRLQSLLDQGVSFDTYTINRYHVLVLEYEKLVEEYKNWNSRVNPSKD